MNLLVGFGVQLIQSAISAHQSAAMQKQQDAQNAGALQDFNAQMEQQDHDAIAQAGMNTYALDMEEPPFPEEAAGRLADMQQTNAGQLKNLSSQFTEKYTAMKNELFEDNHLETAQDGPQPRVVLGQNGKPTLQPGKEDGVQKSAREDYESDTKSALSDSHAQQSDKFVADEKEKVVSFLDQNKQELTNPTVQNELHQMMTQTQKKALNLSSDQEREMMKHDAYTPEMVAEVDNHMDQKTQMQEQHHKMEEDSEEAGELYNHQQDLAALLQQKKDELNELKAAQGEHDQTFLKGPPQFGASSSSEPEDVAKVLPPYLSDTLYGMGVFTV